MNSPNCTDEPCNHCDAECCKYIAVMVLREDTDYIQFLMTHGGRLSTTDCNDTEVVILIDHQCQLLVNNRCSDYENRPRICRDYEASRCPDATIKGSRRKISGWAPAKRFLEQR